MAKEILMTREGREDIERRLWELENVKRAEIGERIRIAREFGDISENSEYDDAKNDQGKNEAEIADLQQQLSNAVLVEPPKRSNKASIGSTVTLVNSKGGERVLTIVGSKEAEPTLGKVSYESAVGSAVLGHKKGESVVVQTPSGKTIEYTIAKIANG